MTRLCTVLWLLVRQQEAQGVNIISLRLRGPGGYVLMVLRYLASSFGGVFASVKQLRKRGHQILLSVALQGGAKQRDGEGSVPGRPYRVLLGYRRNLVASAET